jgi:hypothetical protein
MSVMGALVEVGGKFRQAGFSIEDLNSVTTAGFIAKRDGCSRVLVTVDREPGWAKKEKVPQVLDGPFVKVIQEIFGTALFSVQPGYERCPDVDDDHLAGHSQAEFECQGQTVYTSVVNK